MPAVLLECGVILNRDEEVLLSNQIMREVQENAIADAIDHAIEKGISA